MEKMRVTEFAKKLNIDARKVLDVAKANGIAIKSHLSNITLEECQKLEKLIKGDSKPKSMDVKKEKKNAEEPVIIRRSVTVNEEEYKEDKNEKNTKNRDIGFVEKNRKKDFNIVYRNKPTKPLTVDELFGLKKKEQPKKIEEKVKEVEVKKEEQVASKVESNVKEPEVSRQNIDNTSVKQNQGDKRFNNRDNKTPYNKNNFNRNNNNRNFNRNGDQQNKHFNNQNNNGFRNTNNRNNQKRDFVDKKIHDIIDVDIVEKENVREYDNKLKDKMKQNQRQEEQKPRKNKKSGNSDFDSGKLKDLKREKMFSEGNMLDYYDLSTERGRRNKKKTQKNEKRNKQKIFKLTEITIPESITVKDLATEMKITSGDVIKKLLDLGIMATINKDLDFDTAYLVAQEYGINATKKNIVTEEDILIDETEDKEEELKPRPPVIVVMGHVDHGKTSLLDAIRSTNVIEDESGGITQHIGAYQVKINGRDITFLDTPGHEAFTSMRARGAMITDIAILVVAANDGVMPQTVEAINHAKAANIPIIVAVNKMDLPDANFSKVQQELMKYDLVPEEWGGSTIYVPISAKKHEGIDNLLEMVLLEADVLELKANPTKQAKGTVIEARLDKARGPIATMLVQRGKLDVGDTIIVGTSIGRIRTMQDYKGKKVKSAGPSTPVEITGLTSVPQSGDTFYEVKDEKTAKHLIEKRRIEEREKELSRNNAVTLDDLFSKIESENLKQLNLIVKADVQGSVEALKQSLEKLSNNEVKVSVIHANVGGVTESDVTLACYNNCI